MKKILITGVSSCSGIHAVRHLANRSDTHVFGTARRSFTLSGLQECIECDFSQGSEIERAIRHVVPDEVLHLAGSSDASRPTEMLQTNVLGTLRLIGACERLDKQVKLLLVGSAACFGEMRNDESGLGELRDCRPDSVYGISRFAQGELGRLADGQNQLKIYLCRTFNLIGRGLSDRYVPRALAIRIATAATEGAERLVLRNMSAVRDFVDVRDTVAAYFSILDLGRTAIPYSIGRGEGVTIKQLARLIAAEKGVAMAFIDDTASSSSSRSGITRSIADPTALISDTGWAPMISLKESIRDMLAAREPDQRRDRAT